MHIGKNDPKTIWNIIDKMNKWGNEKTDPAESISPRDGMNISQSCPIVLQVVRLIYWKLEANLSPYWAAD